MNQAGEIIEERRLENEEVADYMAKRCLKEHMR
jgi:hypothetical protein